MGSLFRFLFKYRAFQLFIVLECVCFWLMVQNRSYQGIYFLHSSNSVVGKAFETSSRLSNYFFLAQTNADLAAENARLNAHLTNLQILQSSINTDTLSGSIFQQYTYKVARVINNSVSRSDNYLTINKGLADGIRPGMGVVSPLGVVGRVRSCSQHYSTIISLLHSKILISAEIKRCHAFGTVRWGGQDPFKAKLLYIARHIKPQIGDTVVSSAYSTVIPPGIHTGIIRKINLRDDDTFYEIDIELLTDFSTLSYVYIIENILKTEQDSLQAATSPQMNEQ